MKRLWISLFYALILNSTAATRIMAYNDSNPSISPDGRYVAFHSDRAGNSNIYLFDFETGSTRQLTAMKFNAYGPTWSDRSHIIFYAGQNARMEGYQISLNETAQPELLTKLGGYVGNPVVSPDGQEMLFTWNQGIATGNDHEIFTRNIETGAMTQLTNNEFKDYTPVWSPDGRKIAFASDREGGQFDLYVMDSSGANPRKIADLNPHDYYPEWSPDGEWIAFFSGKDFDHFDAYMVRVETGEIRQLTHGMGAGKLSFCPDGSCIVFGADTKDGSRLFRARPDGSDPALLESFPPNGSSRPATP